MSKGFHAPETVSAEDLAARLVRADGLIRAMAKSILWQARRYADGRRTFAASMYNEVVRALLAYGVEVPVGGAGTIWARDGDGRAYDGLTDEEAAQGEPLGAWETAENDRSDRRLARAYDALTLARAASMCGRPLGPIALSHVDGVLRDPEIIAAVERARASGEGTTVDKRSSTPGDRAESKAVGVRSMEVSASEAADLHRMAAGNAAPARIEARPAPPADRSGLHRTGRAKASEPSGSESR